MAAVCRWNGFSVLFCHLAQTLNDLIGSIRALSMKVLSNSWFSQPSLAYWDC